MLNQTEGDFIAYPAGIGIAMGLVMAYRIYSAYVWSKRIYEYTYAKPKRESRQRRGYNALDYDDYFIDYETRMREINL